MSYRQKRLRVVSVLDPAIDTESMSEIDMVKYFETRDEHIVAAHIKPGMTPTWYHIDEVPHALWESYVLNAPSEAAMHRRAFQCSLRLVENLYQSDGVFLPAWEPPFTNGVMSDESLLRFAAQERSEIGAVAYTHSFFPLRIAVTYPLPHSSLSALAKRTFRSAGVNPSLQAENSENLSSAGEGEAA